MNSKLWIRLSLAAALAVVFTASVFAQNSRVNQLTRPCPGSTTPATVKITPAGSITMTPCSGQTVTPTSGLTAGSVLFAGTSGVLSQDNTNFFWNDTTNILNVNRIGNLNSSFGFATAGITFANGSQISSNADGTIWFGSSAINSFAAFQSAAGLVMGSAQNIGFSSTVDPGSSGLDTSFGRYSAGVIKISNNSPTTVAGLFGGGAAVASAGALPLPTGNVFHVTGTTNITSITSTNFASGVCITLIFDGVLTFTDGSNLKLAGNFVTTADDTISLCYDGSNWYETARAVN